MRLVVGLGNPGKEYQLNRHNIGFLAVDAFSKKHQLDLYRTKKYFSYQLENVLFIKPKTYMNRSGDAILSVMAKETIEDMLVIVDDFNLPFGSLRIRQTGGDGGHNGLKSIQNTLGTSDFKRMRIGIGNPYPESFVNYVLNDFSKEEQSFFTSIFSMTNQLIEIYSKFDFQEMVTHFSKTKATYSKGLEDLRIKRPKEEK